MKLKLSILALVLVAAVAMAPMASATTLTQGPYSATVTVGTNTVTLTIAGPTTGFFVYELAVQPGGTAASTGTGTASAGTWTFLSAQNPNNCGTKKVNNWLCAITTTAQAGNGLTVTWNTTGTVSTTDVGIHFIICSTATLCTQGGPGFITIFSQSGPPGAGGPPPVPEPGTLGLLGTGLVGLAAVVRRRLTGLT